MSGEYRRHLLKIKRIGLKIHLKEQVPGLFTHRHSLYFLLVV